MIDEWRMLGPDEFVEEGDEIWLFSVKKWAPVKSLCTIGNPTRLYPRYKFRRRVSTPATDKETLAVQPCPKCGFDSGWHNVECWMERAEKAEEGFKFYFGAWEQVEKDLAATKAKLQQAEKERDEANRKLAVITGKLPYYQVKSGTQHDGSDVDLEVCGLCGYADGHDDGCFVQRLEGLYEAEDELRRVGAERDQLRAENERMR